MMHLYLDSALELCRRTKLHYSKLSVQSFSLKGAFMLMHPRILFFNKSAANMDWVKARMETCWIMKAYVGPSVGADWTS